MSHRVYLTARTADAETELFAAGNYLPFFWLGLLDQPALAACEKWWLEAEQLARENEEEYERFTDIWPPLTAIGLARPAVQCNAARTLRFLQRHFPALAEAHQEFTRYLLAHLPDEDDQLQLDIDALAAFTSAHEYQQQLRAQVAALDQQQPWQWAAPGLELVELTGFASEATFTEDYPVLRQLSQNRPERRLPPARPAQAGAAKKPVFRPPAGEKLDATFALLTLGLFAAVSLATHGTCWQQRAVGFPLPFWKLPATGPPEWHLGALALDVPLTAFLAWHLRGLWLAVRELVRHWRGR